MVSHDLGAIESYCSRAVRLEEGQVVDEGPAAEVTARYREAVDRRQREAAAAPAGDHAEPA
jgi:ABC-type polysaccharide/polyol phosphate transport system ATPase subunit